MNDLEKFEAILEISERIREMQGVLLRLPFSKYEENIYYVLRDGKVWTICKCSYAQMAYFIANGTDKEMFYKTLRGESGAIEGAFRMQRVYGGIVMIPKKVQEIKDFEIEPKDSL